MNSDQGCFCAELEDELCTNHTVAREQLDKLLRGVEKHATQRPTGREVGAVSIGAIIGAGVASLIAWAL